MAYAKKTKGYRSITVDGHRYRWRFKIESLCCVVTLQDGDQSSGQQVHVKILDITDAWIHFPKLGPSFVVKPRIVPPLVRQALALGWTPGKKSSPLHIELRWTDIIAQLDRVMPATSATSHPRPK